MSIELNTYRPQIVHFSGHGSSAGEIVLVDNNGDAKPVPANALKELFTTLKDNIQIVILNACFSKIQAEAIIQVIDCAIGMAEEISDEAAITFISSFYQAIGFGRSVQDAFEQGKIALMLEGIRQEHIPVLLSKAGVDPSRIVFAHPSSVKNTNFHQAISKINPPQIKVNEIKLNIEIGNVNEFRADVLVLKYAMRLYGADRAVALALDKTDGDVSTLVPRLGDAKLIDTQGVIASEQLLFINVGDRYHFDYNGIRIFASDTLKALSKLAPTIHHIAMTIHGVGYGLDEAEALKVQVAGYIDAIKEGDYTRSLERISIVERNLKRARLLKQVLAKLLPGNAIRISSAGKIIDRTDFAERSLDFEHNLAEKPHVFVAMPFSEEMTDLFYYGIQNPVNQAGFLCERIDVKSFTGDILQRIKSRIESATYIVAEITHPNPNVFLEVGYAWGCGRPTILIMRDSEQLPFDIPGQRCLVYRTIRDLEKILSEELKGLHIRSTNR